MKTTLTPISLTDREPIVDIFNHYVANSFAAFPERAVPYEFFNTLLSMCQGYPTATARDEADEVVGFGMLRPYNPMPAFSKAAEITYFLKPECTGHGIGKEILEYLIEKGKEKGITTILANISSLNPGSIQFHLKNGFVECGRFKNVGQKRERTFDIVYCQRML